MISGNNYYTEIESFLLEKRERGLMVNASDYRIMEKWENMGIPLDVVKNGIELSIDGIKFSTRDSVSGIITLSSCNRKVLKLWRERCEAKKGLQEEWGSSDSASSGYALSEDIRAMITALEKSFSAEWISPQIQEAVDVFRTKLKELIPSDEKKTADRDEEYEKLENLREESFERIISLLNEEDKKVFLLRWDKNLKRIKQTADKSEFDKTCNELLKISIAEKLGF